VPVDEPHRVLHPLAHVDGAARDHGPIGAQVGYLSGRANVYLRSPFAQYLADGLGDPNGRPCAAGIGDQYLVSHVLLLDGEPPAGSHAS